MGNHYVRISKFLSYVLRHNPASIGLGLDAQGWADIDELLACAVQNGKSFSRQTLLDVVAHNDKQRFALSPDGQRIRASQGHSLPIDLGLEPLTPPATLYHGTAARFMPAIQRDGLQSRRRHHVHLSDNRATAQMVGQRHGEPVVLQIDARLMHADGYLFYRSANGVWLTAHVPPQYFILLQD